MPKAYFSHAIRTYGTETEQRMIDFIEALGFEVVNPGGPEIQAELDRVKFWNGFDCSLCHDYVMRGFFYPIIRNIDAVFAHYIGTCGVECEVQYARRQKRPVTFLLNVDGKIVASRRRPVVHGKRYRR